MSTPARLHVLSRINHNNALIIRRGPSKRVGFFGFNLATHEISEGQWLKGRIYERRSDISSCGNYILYFALSGKWRSKTEGSWTALSKFPYLKAIDLWAKGDAWHGGGLFMDNNEYQLNEMFPHKSLEKESHFKVKRGRIDPNLGNNECLGVYFPRLIREGWSLEKSEQQDHYFEKHYNKDWYILKKCGVNKDNKPGRSVYYDTNQLINKSEGIILEIESDWMDFRGHKVYWTNHGQIFYANLKKNRLEEPQLIIDMNDYTFKLIEAPY